MSDRFIYPETVKLEISEGDWLRVKKLLNSGEQRAAFRRIYLATADGDMKINPLQLGVGIVMAYLLDWSLKDRSGNKVEFSDGNGGVDPDALQAALDLLSPESFNEIRTAIEAHEAKQLAAREEEKKLRAGATTSATTSPSLGAAAGVTNGSETLTPMST